MDTGQPTIDGIPVFELSSPIEFEDTIAFSQDMGEERSEPVWSHGLRRIRNTSHGDYGPPSVYDIPEGCEDPEYCRMTPYPARSQECFNCCMDYLGRLQSSGHPTSPAHCGEAPSTHHEHSQSVKSPYTIGDNNESLEIRKRTSLSNMDPQIVVAMRYAEQPTSPPAGPAKQLNFPPRCSGLAPDATKPLSVSHTISHSSGWTPINCSCAQESSGSDPAHLSSDNTQE